jgi:V/A-type H+-transporting ATPase subunit I
MIVKMKKYGIVSYSKDFPNFLDSLQEFGLVDITQTLCNIEGEERKILNWLNFCNDAIQRLEFHKAEKNYETHTIRDPRKATYLLKEFQKYDAEYKQIDEEIKQRDKLYRDFLPWGNYDPELVKQLRENGLELLFFTCDKRSFDSKWNEDYDLEIVNEDKGQSYFVIAKPIHEKILIAANEVKMPDISLNTQMEETDVLKLRRAGLIMIFKEMIPYLPTLYEERTRLQNALSFDRIATSTESTLDDTVRVVQGFLPEEKEADFVAFLDTQPVCYTALDIEESENVPVLLKNNSFAKLYEPITKIFSLPNYKEMDMTPFMAPFFMLFVGFCMGDAGYGLVLLLGGAFAKRKVNADFRPILSLVQWLGFAAILFGIVFGGFFGIKLAEIPALVKFKSYFLNQDNMMILAFACGGVHIVYAKILGIVRVIRRHGFKFAVGRIGWLTLTLSLALAFGLPQLHKVIPSLEKIVIPETLMMVFYVIFALSGVAIFFFNSPGKHPAMQFGSGLWTAYNTATGLFGDFLSYVRLFALGLAGGILGMVFNMLAFEMSPDIPVIGALVTLLILAFGHSLNFALMMLGAFVHPLRLTFVEFYKNVEFEGDGREYKPFKKVKN